MTVNQSVLRTAAADPQACSCPDPVPVARAERKGAAVTVCQRCGRRVPVRLR